MNSTYGIGIIIMIIIVILMTAFALWANIILICWLSLRKVFVGSYYSFTETGTSSSNICDGCPNCQKFFFALISNNFNKLCRFIMVYGRGQIYYLIGS